MERELRKRQNILYITGQGVIAFGLWSLIKNNLYLFLSAEELFPETDEFSPKMQIAIILITFLILLFFSSLELLLRIYVGRSAMNEAKGLKFRKHYVGFSRFLIAFYVFSVAIEILEIILPGVDVNSFPERFASVIVDTTSLIMLIELVSAAKKVRSLRASKNEQTRTD